MRRKGKIHPSPTSSSSCSSPTASKDALSVLKLLPAAILTIVSLLSLDDREVLAYMITRSIKSTNPSAQLQQQRISENSKKSASSSTGTTHKLPSFDCECFDCYTSYWFRWDSSPNRELIHQAIEAFEEHLYDGEQSRKGKNKKKDKIGRRGVGKRPEIEDGNQSPESFEEQTSSGTVFSQSESADLACGSGESRIELSDVVSLDEEVQPEPAVVLPSGGGGGGGANNHKGLARKVLPDVLGLFNSRLWSLWRPNL